MASRKLILGGAGAAALGVRVARALHGRWRRLPRREQALIGPPPAATTEPALEVRHEPDYAAAAASMRAATESLAAALVATTTESDPDVTTADVAQLKGDLRRELERLADADVKASRTGLSAPPRG